MQMIQEFLTNHGATGGAHANGHYVYWVPLSTFNQLPVVPWKFNRPPDMSRVAEIRAFMQESKRADGLIYLAYIKDRLICYESNHRREALKADMPPDMAHILVDIIWDATDELIKQEFMRLNKAISVPDLYIEQPPEGESYETITKAVDSFCAKYPSLKSASGRCQTPNYNRDVFANDFHRIMKELKISADELLVRLERHNAELAAKDHGRLALNVIQKCEKAGLWLFAWSRTLNAKDLK